MTLTGGVAGRGFSACALLVLAALIGCTTDSPSADDGNGSDGKDGGGAIGDDAAPGTDAATGTDAQPGSDAAPATGWPGPSNTGVPQGTTLTPYAGSCTITTAGTVIDAKIIDCDLIIKAANVTISRSRITGSVGTDEDSSGYSFTISDSQVDIGDRPGTGIGAVSFSAIRVHVTGGNRSINCWHDCTIRDSYVHGQFKDVTGTYHESGIRMGQSAQIRHNTILCDAPNVPPDAGCSADLTGYGDFGPVQNNLIQGNLFKATTGGACAYGGSSRGKPFSSATNNVIFKDNVFERGTTKSDKGTYVCGYYFPVTDFDAAAPGNQWSGNAFDDGTAIMP